MRLNILVVDDMEGRMPEELELLKGVALKKFESPHDAFRGCSNDWADVLLIDLSCCGSILSAVNLYGPIITLCSHQANIKNIIINSAVSAAFAQEVADDVKEHCAVPVHLVDWSDCNPNKSLMQIITAIQKGEVYE